MLDHKTVFVIYEMSQKGMQVSKISQYLKVSEKTVRKYRNGMPVKKAKRKRKSKLDPYKAEIQKVLEDTPDISGAVILRHITELGFDGSRTIVSDYLQSTRKTRKVQNAFTRFESPAGKQMQIDWGHFGSLEYDGVNRKLYALFVIESYSRKLYVEFTHSQNQAALHQALVNAFVCFNGTPYEIVVDNMLTAVRERSGKLVAYNEAFLGFLQKFTMLPRACNVNSPFEKGKVERSIQYMRKNFMPLAKFSDLKGANEQVLNWLKVTANQRVHKTTGEKPELRFKTVKLKALPMPLPDVRETNILKVHKDFSVIFDANSYTVPPWATGKKVTVKADSQAVYIYYKEREIAVHKRCWGKRKRIETPRHKEQIKRLQKKMWLDRDVASFASIGDDAVRYIEGLVKTDQPIRKTVTKLLALKDEYGNSSLLIALQKAIAHNAYGADYIENILYQEMTPIKAHLPVVLKDKSINKIRLTEPSLHDYDTKALSGGKRT